MRPGLAPSSLLVGHKQVTPVWRLALIDEYVHATSIRYLELRRKVFQSTQAWPTLAPNEHAVTRTYELVHILDSGGSILRNP
jgi:hypothetical protein